MRGHNGLYVYYITYIEEFFAMESGLSLYQKFENQNIYYYI